MTAVSIQNLSKTYAPTFEKVRRYLGLGDKAPVDALSDVTLEIDKGEVFGLIGRNGAGKTTLTKIIATLVQPTSGHVKVFGNDSIEDDVKVRSLIGLATAEERSFYWRLSCTQNMLFFGRLYGMRDSDAKMRTSELFEQFGLTELAKRRFSNLSTGNKQKLAVARAMLAKPPILLLDEPTRSLDPVAAAEMRSLIDSFDDVTVLLTSHNLSEIEQLCERVAVISKGEIKTIGTPAKLRAQNSETQTVTIELNSTVDESLITLNNLRNFKVERSGDRLSVSFEREHNDELLGNAISELNSKGAKILDVDTERATLLDVLEKYDS
ncbi:MAG: ABC transporter ATP-binding protein [Pyrinomonadaceae bacterium]|nr:ABC transporter ATP-binding protein [Pyrinomonadaceae bacterium]